jgi:DNA-binding beta-propeller fold protein YncE
VSVVRGTGSYRYELVEGWGTLPDGWSFHEVPAVAVDSKDNVYTFTRGEHPVIVFDRDGNFLRSWGEGLFKKPHGIHAAADDTLYCTDEGDDTVRRCTLEGKILLQIGVPGKRAPYMSGEPFHRCTHTALAPNGDIFVSDGYGNARIHKFSPRGKHILSWGEPGIDPGQFNVAHNVCCDIDGWVYVADRENHRIQIFDANGKYETSWHDLHRPNAIFLGEGTCPICHAAESGPVMKVNIRTPNLGARVSVLDNDGKVLSRIGDRQPGFGPGQFMSPHGIAVDSHGDFYVGEVSMTSWPRYDPVNPPPRNLRSLQKWRRLPVS